MLEDPDLAEAAVIGLPDPEWGESVMAVLVAVPGPRSISAASKTFASIASPDSSGRKHWRVVDSAAEESAPARC